MAFFSRSPQPAVEPVDELLAPSDVLISLRQLEKSYAHGTSRSWVLRRITLDIKEGEFVSIMGPSGAGKSTLLHILGMHDSVRAGEYYFGGQPVHRLSTKDRAALHKKWVGFVFQSYHLLDHLTVYENLDAALLPRHQEERTRQHGLRHPRPIRHRRQEGSLPRTSCPADSSSWWPWPVR